MSTGPSNIDRRRALRRARVKYRGMQIAFVAAVLLVVVFVLGHLGWS